jgi:hypothetical protein
LFIGSSGAAESDLYPEARKLLLEAEKAQQFAQAGYIADCLRVASKGGMGAGMCLKARVLYGDLDSALKDARAQGDPLDRSQLLKGLCTWDKKSDATGELFAGDEQPLEGSRAPGS